MVNRLVAIVLFAGAVVFVGLLAGVGSGAITDDPPAVSPYVSGPGVGGGEAQFEITAVVFGDQGYVEVRNVGEAAGSLTGWFLCQFPSYAEIAVAGDLAPGEAVWMTPGDGGGLAPPAGVSVQAGGAIGDLGSDDGEIGLYSSSSFGDSAAIASYVEWGSSDHGRSGVAVGGGVWEEGGFVEVPAGANSIVATSEAPRAPGDWDIG